MLVEHHTNAAVLFLYKVTSQETAHIIDLSCLDMFQDKSLPGKLESMSEEYGYAVLQTLAQLSAVPVM